MTMYDLHHDVSLAAAESLAKFGAPAIRVLSDALRHPEAMVRQHAVIGLGQIRDARVAPLVIEMVHDPDRNVQRQAIHALGALRDSSADAALKAIATDRTDREFSMLAKRILESRPNSS
jgi:HEAT repeat protein